MIKVMENKETQRNCNREKKKKKLLQTKDWGNVTTKCNVVFWMGSLNTKRKSRKTDEINKV